VILWRKSSRLGPTAVFSRGARQTARLEVSNFLRRKRLPTYVSERLLDTLTTIGSEARDDGAEPYLVALRRCRDKLDATDEELLKLRYVQELGIREIADRLLRLQPNVCRSLNRIALLLECIQVELAQQEHSEKEHS